VYSVTESADTLFHTKLFLLLLSIAVYLSISSYICRFILQHFPPCSTTLHFEYYSEVPESTPVSGKGKYSNMVTSIHIDNVDKMNKTPAAIMNELLEQYNVPAEKQVRIACSVCLHVNLIACNISNDVNVFVPDATLHPHTIGSLFLKSSTSPSVCSGQTSSLVCTCVFKCPSRECPCTFVLRHSGRIGGTIRNA